MAKLHISLIWPGCAQGRYTIRAKGAFLATLYWGDAAGPLAGWGPFAYVPVDPAGNGAFFFSGMRGIPPGATHVWARCVDHGFAPMEAISAEIPPDFLPRAAASGHITRFSLLTDLHLTSKPWNVRRALGYVEGDHLLLLGDATNDGLAEQFERFEALIAGLAPGKVILPVIGNHDVVHPKDARGDGCLNYAAFQEKCLENAEAKGLEIRRDPDGLAWAARMGSLDIIGLQCVISERKFLFPEGRMLDWLEARLFETGDADWHLILCHAPLIHHNPLRSDGQPYLNRDRRLQEIVDRAGNAVFLSGHTHISPNVTRACAEWDAARNNLYLNCGSVVDTATEGDSGLMGADWKDGCVTRLTVGTDEIEIETRSIVNGRRFPRGYFRFRKGHAMARGWTEVH